MDMVRLRTLLWSIALLVLPFSGIAAEPPATPLAPLAWLAGSCWTGTFADGTTRDLVCYEWMLGGQFLRSRHRVIGGKAPYAGETILGRNAATGALEYTYFNSAGGVMRGEIVPVEDGLSFPPDTMEMGGTTFEVRSAWKRHGPDRYVATSERLVDGVWKPFMTIDFVRSGPSSDWSD